MGAGVGRRRFLAGGVVAGGAAAFSGALWQEAFAASAQPGPSPYGPLRAPDAHGLRLPDGFSGRVVARSLRRVEGTRHTWHAAPDGGACFADGDGWIYVSNSELPLVGGVGALRFDSTGRVTSAYRTLEGTTLNCAGGATPWNTWLSCEEHDFGLVYETDPFGRQSARPRPAMGRFKHEAAACDPDRRVVYLTEDVGDGCFYRFVPGTWGDLSEGRLEVLVGEGPGDVRWARVPRPMIWTTPTRDQVEGAMRFRGGEGCHYADGVCHFTTKGDNRVWAYDAERERLSIAYDDDLVEGEVTLRGVDNITGSASGDLYVAEDGGDMEINIITPGGVVAPFLQIVGHDDSEVTGPAFTPDGSRLYFSSQRGASGFIAGTGGCTFEVTGPFRRAAPGRA